MSKTLVFTSLIMALSTVAFAQNVNVDGIKTDSEGSTTITIEKNRPNTTTVIPGGGTTVITPPQQPQWEVTSGTADVEGDTSATNREAKDAWKKACKDWKKEFRADNKENKILSMSCGTANCSGDAGNKSCTSTATYKVKTRVD